MIEGLKVTVAGQELQRLCLTRANYHAERAVAYEAQLKGLEGAQIEGMNYSGGDPKRALKDKATEHSNGVSEMQFIANHIDVAETYILDGGDLSKLGITQRGW